MANLDQQSIDENRAPAGGEEELDLEYPQYYKEGAQPIETLPKGKQLTSEDYKELALRLSPEQWRQAFREKNISEADANKFVEQMQELRLKELKTAEDVKGFKKFLKTLSNLPGNKWLRGALAAIMLMVTPIPDVEATQRDEQSSSEQAPAQNLEEAEGHEFTVKYPKGIKVSKEEGIGEAEPEEAVEVDPLAGKDLKIKPRVKLNKTTVKIDQESMRTGNDPSTETLPNPETLFSKGDQFDLKVDWSKRYEAKKYLRNKRRH